MRSVPALPPATRAFIVLMAALQGGLLYLVQSGHDAGWWPFAMPGGGVSWTVVVMAVPSMLMLSVVRLRDRLFWQHAAGLTALMAPLSVWLGWKASGAPGLDGAAVVRPFAVSVAIGLFVALPWLQCRLAHRRWRAPYPDLFEHAWQNALTLALAGLFTALCWLILELWGGLFAMVRIQFFRQLFREAAFAYMATGTMVGLGILIGRTQHRAIQVMRQILFAFCKGLLPLLAFIALLFAASLPFTGLAPLWETRSAATLLISVIVLMVVFVNAVFQAGTGTRPYPAWLRRLAEAGLVVLPLYALLALYALWLRIDQYGWTADRFWMVLLALVAAGYAVGYAWSALRRRDGWLHPLTRINAGMSWAVMAVALIANTPLLDAQRITVGSQLQRLDDGRTPPDDMDLPHLRFETGRHGYQAAQSLRTHRLFAEDPARVSELDRVLARSHRWGGPAPEHADTPATADGLRARVHMAVGSVVPDDAWWEAHAAGALGNQTCLGDHGTCVMLTPDLDGDGEREILLCQAAYNYGGDCAVFARDGETWFWAATFPLFRSGHENHLALLRELREGNISIQPNRWPDLRIGKGRRIPIETRDICRQRNEDEAAATCR